MAVEREHRHGIDVDHTDRRGVVRGRQRQIGRNLAQHRGDERRFGERDRWHGEVIGQLLER
jgi:hypothetical protein